jgi:DNA-binding GntR family transcriptional regulator
MVMLARTVAYQRLRKILLSGEIAQDEPLSERRLSEQLEMGRMPVREALKELAKDGLVHVLRGHGTFIRQLTLDEVRDRYEMRQALEGMAARLASIRGVTPVLKATHEKLKRLHKSKNVAIQKIQKVGWKFHEEVVLSSRNLELVRSYKTLDAQIILALRSAAQHQSIEFHRSACGEHIKIFEAIQQGNADLAEQLMREHLAHSLAARAEILTSIKRKTA